MAISIDKKLVEQARRIGHHRTDREAIHAALEEYVLRRKRMRILTLSGTIEYEEDYDPKRSQMLDKIEHDG